MYAKRYFQQGPNFVLGTAQAYAYNKKWVQQVKLHSSNLLQKIKPCSNDCSYLQWSQVWQAWTLSNKRDQGKTNIIYVIITSCLPVMQITLSWSGYLSQRWNNNNAHWHLRGDVKRVFTQTALCSSTAKNSDLHQLHCWYMFVLFLEGVPFVFLKEKAKI